MFVRPQPLGPVFHCGSRPHPSSTKDLKSPRSQRPPVLISQTCWPKRKLPKIRMSRNKDDLGLTLGPAGPEDTIFAHEGLAVLAIDEVLSQALADDTLDVETTENGTALQLR